MGHAIDKKEIVDAVLLGLGSPAERSIQARNVLVQRQSEGGRVRPGEGEELARRSRLERLGWRRCAWIARRPGVQFEIITNKGNEQREKRRPSSSADSKRSGSRSKIKVIEWAAFINNFIDKRKFDAVVARLEPESRSRPVQHLAFVEDARRKSSISSRTRIAEVDALLEKGRRTFDQDERKSIYDRLQEVLEDEQPYTFLYRRGGAADRTQPLPWY